MGARHRPRDDERWGVPERVAVQRVLAGIRRDHRAGLRRHRRDRRRLVPRSQGTVRSRTGLYLGTIALLVVGALYWGWQLADFNTFHVFFAALAIFATPVAAVAVWSIWLRLRATGHVRVATVVLVLCALQIEFGMSLGVTRLVSFGPGKYAPVPVAVLEEVRKLPPDAKLAYACQPLEEDGFWYPSEGALAAHTGRDFVPMCFQAETFPRLTGATLSADVPSPFFQWAPQRSLYPDVRDASPHQRRSRRS